MMAEAFEGTGLVVIVNVAVVCPVDTLTLAGTCAALELLLDRVTMAPPGGAAAAKVTVPVDEVPPTTEVGLSVTLLREPVKTVRLAVWVDPYVPEIVTAVFELTTLVVIGKVAVVALAATVTLAGTCAAEMLLLDKVTTAPPAGAGPVNVTVPVEVAPPGRDVGLSATELRVGRFTVKDAVCVVP
jgi:hypothetical protein